MHCVVQTEAMFPDMPGDTLIEVWGPFATEADAITFASDAASYQEATEQAASIDGRPPRLRHLPHTWAVSDLRSVLTFTPPDA